jgi:hypothetical protein
VNHLFYYFGEVEINFTYFFLKNGMFNKLLVMVLSRKKMTMTLDSLEDSVQQPVGPANPAYD